MKTYKTYSSIFYVDDNGIVHKEISEGINLKPQDVVEDQKLMLTLTKGKKALVMVHADKFHTLTPEAVKRLNDSIAISRQATAVVAQSLAVRIFVDTIVTLNKGEHAFSMFETEKEAAKWLLGLKKQHTQKKLHNPAIGPKLKHAYNTAACEVRIDKNGILVKKIFDGAHINLAIAKKAEAQALKLAGKEKLLALVDRSASYTITSQASKYLQKNVASNYRIATALVLAKPGHVKPPAPKHKERQKAPVKVFTNKTMAVKWLLSLKKEDTKRRPTT